MGENNPPTLTPELLEQNPVLAGSLFLFTLLCFAFVVGIVSAWCYIGYQLLHRRSILTVEPWSPRVWGLADVVVTVVLLLILQVFAVRLGINLLNLDLEALRDAGALPLPLTAIASASYLVTMGCVTLWIVVRFNVSPSHVGFTISKLKKHLFIGLVFGLAVFPVVMLLSILVSLGFNTPYDHPLLSMMREDGSLVSYLLAVFAAVLVAPIFEEFLFRVVLQGWLQSIPFSTIASNILGASEKQRSDPTSAAFFHTTSIRADDSSLAGADAFVPSLADQTLESNNPYRTPSIEVQQADEELLAIEVNNSIPPIWPSIVTGILFGLAHWGYGLSFIPLIVLGIVLGLIYRATHSIWPCILVHMLLNASSMLALGLNMLMENAISP